MRVKTCTTKLVIAVKCLVGLHEWQHVCLNRWLTVETGKYGYCCKRCKKPGRVSYSAINGLVKAYPRKTGD